MESHDERLGNRAHGASRKAKNTETVSPAIRFEIQGFEMP
jgi:hypothetical protein